MIPRPLAWGIIIVLTGLEALNVIAAVFRAGYVSDPLVHFAFTTTVGFMLGMKEGSGVVSRAMTVFRNIASPLPAPSAQPPLTQPLGPTAPPAGSASSPADTPSEPGL